MCIKVTTHHNSVTLQSSQSTPPLNMAALEVKCELDPTIWSNLPRDIRLNIIDQSDISTQINWSCTSREFYPAASCKIWRSQRVHSSEITAYVDVVTGIRYINPSDGILHFLLQNSCRRHRNNWDHVFAKDCAGGLLIHRPNGMEPYSGPDQLTATLPASFVKNLEIDNQGLTERHRMSSRSDMDCVLLILYRCLPNLQFFRYLGPISVQGLAAVMQIRNLKVLQIRNGSDILELFSPTLTHTMPWIDIVQDWSVLAKLEGLQTLQVGRLLREEAGGLARGVAALRLRSFHVSCWGWDYGNTIPRNSTRSTIRKSALVVFLEAIATLDIDSGQAHCGLPSTLKHLVLVDRYHACIPSLYQLVTTAILPCEKLDTLQVTMNVNGKCYQNISRIGLPACQKIVGLRSWQQLCCGEGIRVLHQYQSLSGATLQTDPHPRPLHNIARTLDGAIEAAVGIGDYQMSLKFVRGLQFRDDEILIHPCQSELDASVAEGGPQAQDAQMMDLVAKFQSLSLEEGWWFDWLAI